MAAHSSRSCRPAAEWITLSMQLCPGRKQPSRREFAALTMASASRRVRSPCQSTSRESEGRAGSSDTWTTPFCAYRTPWPDMTATETFFASQGADAFVAPEEVVWTGAGVVGDFSDGDNWEGGSAPADLHKVAVFPSATTIEAADTDCAGFFNKLGAVRLAGSDTKLHFTNILNAVSFYAPVGGEGSLCIQSLQNVAKNFSIYSASPNFRGTFMLTNAYVSVLAGYALGAKEMSEAVYDSSFGNMRLQLQDYNRCHAKIRLRRSGQFVFTNNGVWTDVEWIFDGASDVSYHANGTQTFTFSGPIADGGTLQKTVSYTSGHYAFAGDSKNFGLRKVTFSGGSSDRFAAPISFATRAKDATIGNQANIVQGVGNGTKWIFEADNVFSTNTFALLSYATLVASLPVGTVDLNGHDQRIGTLGVYASAFDASTTWNTNLVITSASPATLTILGNMRDDGCAQVFPGRLSGAASLKINSLEEVMATAWNWSDSTVPGAIKFNNPMNDTTGALGAERGTVEIAAALSQAGIENAVISSGGPMVAQLEN